MVLGAAVGAVLEHERMSDMLSNVVKVMQSLLLAFVVSVVGVSGARAQGALTAEDLDEIRQLYARYNLTIDSDDTEAWVALFTEDGVSGNSEGREALIQLATRFQAGPLGNSRHWNNSLQITATADGADGTCYLQVWNLGSSPPSLAMTGIYHDTLVKTADGWRFKTRRVDVDPPAQ